MFRAVSPVDMGAAIPARAEASLVGWPRLDAGCPPKLLDHCPLQLDGARKYDERLVGQEEDREITWRLLSKHTWLGEN